MIKIFLTVAVLSSTSNITGLAMAQDKQGGAFTNDVSALLAKKDAQCTHRRTMPPDTHDGCTNKRLSDAQTDQSGASANNAQAFAAGPGNRGGGGDDIGPGRGGGDDIGPGRGGGGGKGKK